MLLGVIVFIIITFHIIDIGTINVVVVIININVVVDNIIIIVVADVAIIFNVVLINIFYYFFVDIINFISEV